MLEQLAFQIEHDGTVFNANRSYFLSRSQPPLFTRVVRDIPAPAPDLERLGRCGPTSPSSSKQDQRVNGLLREAGETLGPVGIESSIFA